MAGRKVVLRGGQGKPRSIRDSEANGPKASVGRGSRVCSSTISSDFPHFSLGGLLSSACWFHILMSQGPTIHSRYKTRVYLWPIHVDVWQEPSQYCKVIILQSK